MSDALPVSGRELREVFLRRDRGGWFVEDKNGWSLAYTFTKWGARRAARRILHEQALNKIVARERITL